MTKTERLVLTLLADRAPRSIVALRSAVNLDVENFVRTISSLEGKGYISRNGLKITISDAGRLALNGNRTSTPTSEYVASVTTYQLSVTEFYLPDREKFLQALSVKR